MTDSELSDNLLPSRLFATDRYPRGRLNVYSKPDTLCFIRKHMKGSPEYDRILNSCFGSLFELPVAQCPISCKLIHALICRQLITKKKYELWTVFGGQPLRFSLVEFGVVSGLPCGEFPENYDPHSEPEPEEGVSSYWDELIGDENAEFCFLQSRQSLTLQGCCTVEFLICLVLTIIGYIPEINYALYVIVFQNREGSHELGAPLN